MIKFLNILKSPLTLAAKSEIKAADISAAIFFNMAALPLILRPAKKFMDKPYYKTLLRAGDAFQGLKAFQLHTLGRVGILDQKYVGKNSYAYFANGLTPAERVDTAIKWNKDGALSDQDALNRMKIGIGWQWVGATEETQAAQLPPESWKKAFEWADGKVSSVLKSMNEKEQEKFSYEIFNLLRVAPVKTGETPGGMFIPPLHSDTTRPYIIFNEKATKSGQHLVTCGLHAEPLPQAVQRLDQQLRSSYYEDRYVSEAVPEIRTAHQAMLKDLRSYQRKNPAPAV
jgi:hypothetical protein